MPFHSAREGGAKDGGGAHPCESGAGSNGSQAAVDQDHKACDEHTQGESRGRAAVGRYTRLLPITSSTIAAVTVRAVDV